MGRVRAAWRWYVRLNRTIWDWLQAGLENPWIAIPLIGTAYIVVVIALLK